MLPAHHPNDDRIVIDEASHVYIVDDVKRSVSVTSLVKSPWPPFHRESALATARANGKYKNKTDEQVFAMWTETGDDASRRGVRMHAAFAADLRAQTDDPEFVDELGMMRRFMQAEIVGKNRAVVRIESPIFCVLSDGSVIPGTPDLVFWDPAVGAHGIVDWKRCVDIHRGFGRGVTPAFEDISGSKFTTYELQLHAYAEILERAYDIKVDRNGLFIVNCHPLNFFDEYEMCKANPSAGMLVATELFDRYASTYKRLAEQHRE